MWTVGGAREGAWALVYILHKTLGGDLNKMSKKWLGQKLPKLPTL